MTEWSFIDRDGTRLAIADFGGSGPEVLCLHGLAGHASEWADTADRLSKTHHVLALDARGHGRSERDPDGLGYGAQVEDVIAVIRHVASPVSLIGQSLGGVTALLVAARRPEFVSRLVVAEASPAGCDPDAAAALEAGVVGRLRAWSVPFPSREDAISFFGGPSLAATAWAGGLEERNGALWPAFDTEVLRRMLKETLRESHWEEWRKVRCPTLVVRGTEGSLTRDESTLMIERLPKAQLVEIPGAGHDVHLERPEEWHRVVHDFLSRSGRDPAPG